jgi:hypothetical protein
LLHISRFILLGSYLVGGSKPLCLFSWGFFKDYLGLGSGWAVGYFLVCGLGMCCSVAKHSASVLKILWATSYSTNGEES